MRRGACGARTVAQSRKSDCAPGRPAAGPSPASAPLLPAAGISIMHILTGSWSETRSCSCAACALPPAPPASMLVADIAIEKRSQFPASIAANMASACSSSISITEVAPALPADRGGGPGAFHRRE